MATEQQLDHAKQNAEAGLASILAMVAALECDYDRMQELKDERDSYTPTWSLTEVSMTWAEAFPDEAEELKELEEAAGDCQDEDDARQRIDEDPLSIEIRSGWYTPGSDPEPAEYCILLTTGGPALRLIGELDEYNEPSSARLEYQDWFTPWTELVTTGQDNDQLLTYARQFYYGE